MKKLSSLFLALAASITLMQGATVDLSTLTAAYTAQDGDTLTGTLADNYQISIADGATVALDDVSINADLAYRSQYYGTAGITCSGDATLVLVNENIVKGTGKDHPGIFIAEGKTLTIQGDGALTVETGRSDAGTSNGAGIGGGYHISCGNIVILGGTITTTPGTYACGIGGGSEAACGTITIGGGITSITTTAGYQGDYIGAGYSGTCGTILIANSLIDITKDGVRTLTPSPIPVDEDGYYLLGSLQDWLEFAEIETNNHYAKARMTADINLGTDQTIIGQNTAYQGIFDGQGHTLTVNLNSADSYWAPFRFVGDGAKIKNLRIAGTVNGTHPHRWIGGFVGQGNGTYSINNCISSITLNTTYNGDGVQGGFVAAQRGTALISDCIFDGVFYGPNAYTWGGMVGWHYYVSTTISNCLVLCDSYNVSMTDVATFVPNDNNITNCYYKTAIGTAQGTQVTEEQLADGTMAAALQNGRAEEIWVQDPVLHTPMLKLFANDDPSTPTAINNTATNTNATKRIVNGQLLIEKNGKFYNATGIEVK